MLAPVTRVEDAVKNLYPGCPVLGFALLTSVPLESGCLNGRWSSLRCWGWWEEGGNVCTSLAVLVWLLCDCDCYSWSESPWRSLC